MLKIRKDDTVQVIKGKDRGKRGKILKSLPQNYKAIVEGINLAKKHRRQTRQDQQGGIVRIEMPVNISNLMLVCKHCNRPIRVGFKNLADKTKVRICKACKQAI